MRKATLALVLLSAFFVSSCGMPQYILCPEYSFEPSSSYDEINIGSLELIEDEDDTSLGGLLENCDGPSIAFFYVISNSSSKYAVDAAISRFTGIYRINGYQGIALSTDNNTVFSFSDNSETQYLYLLSAKGESKQSSFSAPYYMIRLKDGKNALNANITHIALETTAVTDSNVAANKALKLTFSGSDYEFNGYPSESELTLYRFNGRPFVAATDVSTESSYTNEDYANISDKAYIHLFAAFCISPNSNSEFNNIFWSELTYMGSISL